MASDPITSVDDDRLKTELFETLRDLPAAVRRGDRLRYVVTEGKLCTEKLCSSGVTVHALVLPLSRRDSPPLVLPESIRVQYVEDRLLNDWIGFEFHRGVLGIAERPKTLELADYLGRPGELSLGLIGVHNQDNVGSLIRSAVGLGISSLWLDRSSADIFSRRVVRVSMGHSLSLPSGEMESAISFMSQSHAAGIETIAMTPRHDAIPLSRWNDSKHRPRLLLLGNEGHGLPDDVIDAATHRVSIPMADSVDSLNVAVAGAIAMHWLSYHEESG